MKLVALETLAAAIEAQLRALLERASASASLQRVPSEVMYAV